VKLEQQLLPHDDLKPLYDKAIWLYVYRTFKGDEQDRAAERASIRFSVTSWPQLFLVDPVTLRVLGHTGRTAASFKKAFAAGQLKKTPSADVQAAERATLAKAEAVAQEVRTEPDIEFATAAVLGKLGTSDIVVRTRAVEVLADLKPAVLVTHAGALLRTPNDTFRYLVCQALGKASAMEAAPHLEALVTTPEPSLNPNVLRMRAVQALATCGRPESVKVIAPHAASGIYFNGLTGVAVDTLAAIAKRHPTTTAEVERVLRSGYPTVTGMDPETKLGKRALRSATALARRIHTALADPRPFPIVYNEAAREALRGPPK